MNLALYVLTTGVPFGELTRKRPGVRVHGVNERPFRDGPKELTSLDNRSSQPNAGARNYGRVAEL